MLAAAEGTTAARPAAPAGIQPHLQLQLCCCCNVLSVREVQGSQHGTNAIAAATAADAGPNTDVAAGTDADQGAGVPCGEVLLDAAVASCAAAGTETDLILLLVAAAAAAQQQQQQQQREDVREAAQGQQLSEQQQRQQWVLPDEPWVQYYGQQWLAQWEGCAGGFEQVLPWWLVPANQELVGLIQGGCDVVFGFTRTGWGAGTIALHACTKVVPWWLERTNWELVGLMHGSDTMLGSFVRLCDRGQLCDTLFCLLGSFNCVTGVNYVTLCEGWESVSGVSWVSS
jgi:hypothetical protein